MSEKLFPGSGCQRSVMMALREVIRDRCWWLQHVRGLHCTTWNNFITDCITALSASLAA